MYNFKFLEEKRAAKQAEMQVMLEKIEKEERAFSDEENAQFDALEKELKDIDRTIEIAERARKLDTKKPVEEKKQDDKKEDVEAIEERAFANYIRSNAGAFVEERADVNLTKSANGAVIPKTIANKIIKKVVDICPIYKSATRYNVKGTLAIPAYDEDTTSITMAYADEFSELESKNGKFTSIELTGFLAGALSKVSKSLINNSQFNIVPFVINAMAESISEWIEGQLLKGTTGKAEGLSRVTKTVTAKSATAITMDEMIQLKDSIKDVYQNNAYFIMSSATRTALRLLKDGNNRYLMQDDVTSPFGTTLFGKPVYVSDNMDEMEAGKTAVYYGDFSGLAVKVSEELNIQVLQEKYATQHAVGIVAWMEFDAKVENAQKIAKLVMKASA